MQVNSTPDKGQATYAWALLNGACDDKTQAEFDALSLVPIEGRSFQPMREDRSIESK